MSIHPTQIIQNFGAEPKKILVRKYFWKHFQISPPFPMILPLTHLFSKKKYFLLLQYTPSHGHTFLMRCKTMAHVLIIQQFAFFRYVFCFFLKGFTFFFLLRFFFSKDLLPPPPLFLRQKNFFVPQKEPDSAVKPLRMTSSFPALRVGGGGWQIREVSLRTLAHLLTPNSAYPSHVHWERNILQAISP